MAEKQNTNIRSVADEPGNMRTIRRADVTLIHDSLIPCFSLMMSGVKGVGEVFIILDFFQVLDPDDNTTHFQNYILSGKAASDATELEVTTYSDVARQDNKSSEAVKQNDETSQDKEAVNDKEEKCDSSDYLEIGVVGDGEDEADGKAALVKMEV